MQPIDAKIKVLIVEDMVETAEVLKATLEETVPVDVSIQSDFDAALIDLLPNRSIEIVILDLYLGNPIENANNAGQKVWEKIWNTKLVPVVIYTASETDLDPELPQDNPFIRSFTKGADSDRVIAEYIHSILPHVQALRNVEQEINRAMHFVLKHTAPRIWNATRDAEALRPDLLVRSARRRLAALMDHNTLDDETSLQSWEQFIYPPLGESLLMGDILRLKESPVTDSASFRVVLTPSCDLQMNKGRCKVDLLLTAKCTDINSYIQAVRSTYSVRERDMPERLPRFLNEPHTAGYIALPEFEGVLPHMAVNLRDLELIPVTGIGLEEEGDMPYIRVVSVDSPFREHLAWAYMQVAGRPGVPNRDVNDWTRKILATGNPGNQQRG